MSCREVRIQIEPKIKKINDQLEKLKESIAVTDGCVVDVYGLEERLEGKLGGLEEELTSVKADNIELKDHLNSVIKELDDIKDLLNGKYGGLIEKT